MYVDVHGVDNQVVIWKYLDAETQRKIKVKVHGLKMELWGEWDSDENRYAKWRKYIYMIVSELMCRLYREQMYHLQRNEMCHSYRIEMYHPYRNEMYH